MIFKRVRTWLAGLSLLFSLSAFADVTVDTESLHLQFNGQGDLLLAEACFPSCAKTNSKTRLLSATQGMLVFDRATTQDWQLKREISDSTTTLFFTDPSGS